MVSVLDYLSIIKKCVAWRLTSKKSPNTPKYQHKNVCTKAKLLKHADRMKQCKDADLKGIQLHLYHVYTSVVYSTVCGAIYFLKLCLCMRSFPSCCTRCHKKHCDWDAVAYTVIPPYGDLISVNSRALSVFCNYKPCAFSVIYSAVRERDLMLLGGMVSWAASKPHDGINVHSYEVG